MRRSLVAVTGGRVPTLKSVGMLGGGSAVELEELAYSRGQLSADQVQQEIARFWTELEASPELQEELAGAGISSDLFRDVDPSDAITVRVDSSGVDPISVALIVAFAPAANRALKDVWTTVLLPRIRRRWGDDAIGDQRRGRDS
jgi:hypothetical protein